LLVIILSEWDYIYLDKHGQLIHDAIKKGLSDADSDARSNARRSFRFFREHFSLLADALLASLELSKRKALMVCLEIFFYRKLFHIFRVE
jgi:CLIP-associating protein 1/2